MMVGRRKSFKIEKKKKIFELECAVGEKSQMEN